jgi:hypothetical protein
MGNEHEIWIIFEAWNIRSIQDTFNENCEDINKDGSVILKYDITEGGWEGMDCINTGQDRDQW